MTNTALSTRARFSPQLPVCKAIEPRSHPLGLTELLNRIDEQVLAYVRDEAHLGLQSVRSADAADVFDAAVLCAAIDLTPESLGELIDASVERLDASYQDGYRLGLVLGALLQREPDLALDVDHYDRALRQAGSE